jgi:putative Mg2+ transporter-C (MgtC) family protein
MPAPDLAQLAPFGRIALAMLLGAVLGYERQLAAKPAGLRTHMLVAGAAALLMALGDAILEEFHGMVRGAERVTSDPLRIIEAVITGVSFLGAGTIIRRHENGDVEGLTTAASLLLTAGIGLAVAVGHFVLALGTTLLTLVTLRVLRRLEEGPAVAAREHGS